LLGALKEKKANLPPDLLNSVETEVTRIIEDNIWCMDESKSSKDLVDSLERVYLPADSYLSKIFQERILSVYGLKLFLKFFPSQLNIFYERLKEARFDLEFLSQIIKIISRIDLAVSRAVLKEIFSFGNELVRVEVLKAMRESGEFDPGFVLALLKDESRILKKAALEVLLRDSAFKQKALDELLGLKNPWGMNNQIVLDNIIIIRELNVREAADYLLIFSKRRFFWNRELKVKALALLKEWA
jgi:hypothetical protein